MESQEKKTLCDAGSKAGGDFHMSIDKGDINNVCRFKKKTASKETVFVATR
jgi:hypothetical protein